MTPLEEGSTRLALLALELQVRVLMLLLYNSVLTQRYVYCRTACLVRQRHR